MDRVSAVKFAGQRAVLPSYGTKQLLACDVYHIFNTVYTIVQHSKHTKWLILATLCCRKIEAFYMLWIRTLAVRSTQRRNQQQQAAAALSTVDDCCDVCKVVTRSRSALMPCGHARFCSTCIDTLQDMRSTWEPIVSYSYRYGATGVPLTCYKLITVYDLYVGSK
jgi:Zinc finger, C3HC4 type (RING finger)